MTGTLESSAICELEGRHGSGVYAQRAVALVRGAGSRVWDAEGREYLDLASGHGVANIGHAHPRITSALERQASTLVTCPGTYANDRRAELLVRLTRLLPGGLERIFLCNSGTEAVEAALKFARISTGRPGVVAAMRGFHGRTFGALSATWDRKYRAPFEPLVPGFGHVPFGKLDAVGAVLDEETACVLVEVVQGEGGVHPGTGEYLLGLRDLCESRGALLIVDEVQTGFGRTGAMFACDHHGLAPDLLCLGKALGGGLPMGAVAMGPRVAELAPGVHGSTFGGNPLACAAALASLDVLEEEQLAARAREHGQAFLARLRALESPAVREIRGLGLMIGIELKTRVTPYLEDLLERGILALPAGATVLRLLPPLNTPLPDLERALGVLTELLLEEPRA